MRAVLRRVTGAQVKVGNYIKGQIDSGILLYLGVHNLDTKQDLDWMVQKILGIRIFEDENGKMNLPIATNQGILVISQFTLFGNLKKGYRPSFHRAAEPVKAKELYGEFLKNLEKYFDGMVQSGEFGKEMTITATDQGPVTMVLDSSLKDF
ncbi:MAG: D-aminoacyl-tRNA deacylase [Verrucomicrobiota bacterium]|nr:D-aminoacyl-tRNA deacylase [Verrucomicrobiota bacterium]